MTESDVHKLKTKKKKRWKRRIWYMQIEDAEGEKEMKQKKK